MSGTPLKVPLAVAQPSLLAPAALVSPAPTLVALVPAASLPQQQDVGRFVTLWQPAQGGHVGFPAGRFPSQVQAMPQAVSSWLADHAGQHA